jgi:hypothetical protein
MVRRNDGAFQASNDNLFERIPFVMRADGRNQPLRSEPPRIGTYIHVHCAAPSSEIAAMDRVLPDLGCAGAIGNFRQQMNTTDTRKEP